MKNFFKSSFVVAFGTFLSRISGLARELLLAWFFGASSAADSINVAFKLPNLFRRIFAEGALGLVFIPIFSAIQDDKEKAMFASQTLLWLSTILFILTCLLQYFMPDVILLIAPGFKSSFSQFTSTIFLCRITICYLILISICALIGGILNSYNQFSTFALNQVVLNISIISFTLVCNYLNLYSSEVVFALSLLFGGFMQIVFMFLGLRRVEFRFIIPKTLRSDYIKTLLIRIVPAIGSASVVQINLFISQIIASFITGAISVLNFAERLYQFPLSILGITFSTVLLPELSRLYKSNNDVQAHLLRNKVVKLGLVLSLPCSAGLMIFSYEFIELIYQRGAFDAAATLRVANVLFWFSLGLPAFVLSKIISTTLYARGNTKKILHITIYSLAINVILNLLLMYFFQESGIAMGSSLAAWCNLAIVIYVLHKEYNEALTLERDFLGKFLLLNALTIVGLVSVNYLSSDYYFNLHVFGKAIFISILISTVASVYCYVAYKAKLIVVDLDRLFKRKKI